MDSGKVMMMEKLEQFKTVAESNIKIDKSISITSLNEMQHLMSSRGFLSNSSLSLSMFERLFFREILELSIVLSVRLCDYDAISSYFSQIRYFYFDHKDLPISERMSTILSIKLLMDLANGRMEDFLMDSSQAITYTSSRDIYINYVFDVQLALASNSFRKMVELQQKSPSVLFNCFMTDLVQRIRKSLANDIIKCSKSLQIRDLMSILHLDTEEQTVQYSKDMNWQIDQDNFVHIREQSSVSHTEGYDSKLECIISSALRFNSIM